ncbi:hypothetical protein [Methylocystis hirsuta]|uniref:Uncharacterized protein n=1 Tax=Methylocystis hirsuta TaxID=369798 RepID=A0A3M9XKB9_9HYPH|nr:hypothetical protein [Methylocystis hirsuta]RNJ48667.1 hypothetical protein D1O30_02505 [Methylocystis hirsuta]
MIQWACNDEVRIMQSGEARCGALFNYADLETRIWKSRLLRATRQRGGGEIAFGATQATLDVECAPTSTAFACSGFDEMDEISRERNAELLADRSITIEFKYDSSDENILREMRDGFSTAC